MDLIYSLNHINSSKQISNKDIITIDLIISRIVEYVPNFDNKEKMICIPLKNLEVHYLKDLSNHPKYEKFKELRKKQNNVCLPSNREPPIKKGDKILANYELTIETPEQLEYNIRSIDILNRDGKSKETTYFEKDTAPEINESLSLNYLMRE